MKKIIYISLAVAMMLPMMPDLFAQEYYNDQLAIENLTISKEEDNTDISMDVNFSNLNLNKNEMLIITPVIISPETENTAELEPFTVIGKLRNKALKRSYNSIGKVALKYPEENRIVRKNGTDQSIQYTTSLPYEEWQRKAQLILKTEVIGCADCLDNEPDKLLSERLLPERFVPEYSYTHIVPEVEEIKQRSETYSAYLNYVVGRWNLLRDFKNNAVELKKVEDIILELKNDPDLSISDFTITGYASPEGSSQSNLMLSQKRAESFATFIEGKYEFDAKQFTIKWEGEDWNGLSQAVAESSLANKNDIIEIINTVSDQDARDARLIALDNGVTYRRLLNDFYPQLRRNDYRIAFVSRPFNVEEASEIIKTRPKLLSLNEMFHVANTFPAESAEFREVIEIAANTFPESEIANMNVAVTELKNNNTDAALKRLEKIKDNPASWNLLGVAYAQKGMTEQAEEYFRKAIEQGDKSASNNLQQLERYINDN
ncbi:MAG: DUF3868 domain-containing protein [Fermentimonas sp.]|nr:DUF3868 domain-containing protein [Fermentimonas sp.]